MGAINSPCTGPGKCDANEVKQKRLSLVEHQAGLCWKNGSLQVGVGFSCATAANKGFRLKFCARAFVAIGKDGLLGERFTLCFGV